MATRPAVTRTIASLRRALMPFRKAGGGIALVPTMGALHAGHLALVREARRRARRVVVSIYDLARYLSEPPEDKEESVAEQKTTQQPRAPKAKPPTEKSKPTRRPPSLAKTLLYLRKSVEDLETQMHFQNALFAELEAIALNKHARHL